MEFGRRVLLWAVAVSGAFIVLMILAPLMAPYGSFRHLDGQPWFIDGGWEGHGFASVLYAIGDMLCHQEFDRSFVLNGSQMPLCVRDTGIFLGLPIGFAVCSFLSGRLADRRIAYLAVVLVAVTVVEWIVETTGVSSVPARFVSGISAGFGASLFLGWMLYRDS